MVRPRDADKSALAAFASSEVAFGSNVNYLQVMETAAARTMEGQIRRMTPVAAPPDQQAEVAALFKALEEMSHVRRRRGPRCRLVGPTGETIVLPESVFYVLERVVEVMARGDSITVVPVGREVTTQQAADLLNVSRQYLVRLLDEKRIPFRKTGKHRRLRIEDVLEFKEKRDKDRRAGLRELSRMSQEFGGYQAEVK
jgi:excisionase family DNA binding protein